MNYLCSRRVPCKRYVSVVLFKLNCCLRGRWWLLLHYRKCWRGNKDELEQLQFLRKWNDLHCLFHYPPVKRLFVRFYAIVSQFVVIYCISENGSTFDDCVIISPHFITFPSLPPLLLLLSHPGKVVEVLQQRFPTHSSRVVCNWDHSMVYLVDQKPCWTVTLLDWACDPCFTGKRRCFFAVSHTWIH